MSNHYHVVLETPDANLVPGMAWLQSTYTIRLNHRHQLIGHVLSGRYRAQVVDGSGNGYLRTACDYVHLNPVRAHLLKPEERLLAYPWSSFVYYLAAPQHRPEWVRVDRLLGEHGIQQDTVAGRQLFEQRMEARRIEEGDQAALSQLRRGWFVGSEPFKAQLLEKIDGKLGEHHSGQLHHETAQVKAERIIAEELQRVGWQERDLALRAKSDSTKLQIARRVRKETTLSIKEIATRIHLGTSKSANVRLHAALVANSHQATQAAQPTLAL
jgi:putative transposase